NAPGPGLGSTVPGELVALADLAEFDEDDEPRPAVGRATGRGGLRTGFDPIAQPADGGMPAAREPMSGGRMSASEKSWLVRCVAIGLALVGFVIGADLVIKATSSDYSPPIVEHVEEGAKAPRNVPEGAPPVVAPAPAPVVTP